MLGQAGQGGDQPIHERFPQLAGRPGFQGLQVQFQAYDREMRVLRGANIDGTFEDAHALPHGWVGNCLVYSVAYGLFGFGAGQ